MVIEKEVHNALLIENQQMLSRLAENHDLSGSHEIEISSRFPKKEGAFAAREYVEKKYGITQDILFRVLMRKYTDIQTIDLSFDLIAEPSAEIITMYELMLRDAAEKYGGEMPGWEIRVK
jgi:Regulator of ribonuclease activity B